MDRVAVVVENIEATGSTPSEYDKLLLAKSRRCGHVTMPRRTRSVRATDWPKSAPRPCSGISRRTRARKASARFTAP
jgi:hypothetical protein